MTTTGAENPRSKEVNVCLVMSSPMQGGEKHMDADMSDTSNCHAPLSEEIGPKPVPGGSYGEGLPYAPVDWPARGDICKWRVGNRSTSSGFWVDRFLYLPSRLKSTGTKMEFRSKTSLEEYIRKEYPDTNLKNFFSSFTWSIPCEGERKEKSQHSFTTRRKSEVSEGSGSDSTIKDRVCKVGNNMCNLNVIGRSNSLAAKACDVCCSEAGFCRNCSCILCCKSIDWSHGGYSFIKCEAILDENYICGHVAHLDCALRCFMAGTVGGSIGLDVEYYCRRCDNKTNLIPHVTKLIKICESPDSEDKILEILNMGLCLLRGSEQTKARNLQKQMELAMAKHKGGSRLGNILNVGENTTTPNAGNKFHGVNGATILGPQGIKRRHSISANTLQHPEGGTADGRVCISSGPSNVSMEFEDDVGQFLRKLKTTLESGYTIVEQKLYAQKNLLVSLQQQLEAERSELVESTTSGNGRNVDAVVANVKDLVKQTEHENTNLRSMMLIANGFRDVLAEQFGRLL